MRHVRSWNTSRWPLLASLALTAAVTACSDKGKSDGLLEGAPQLSQGLHAFADCKASLDYFKREATRQMALQIEAQRRWSGRCVMHNDAGEAADSATSAPASPSAGGSAPTFSGTNNQVTGVDEADLLKTFTVGTNLYTAYARSPQWWMNANGTGSQPGSVVFSQVSPVADAKVVGRVSMPQSPVGLFVNYPYAVALVSDYVAAFPSPYGNVAMPAADMFYYGNAVKIAVIDIHDITQPKVVRERWVQGSFVSARMIDKAVRVVTTAWQRGPVLQYWPENINCNGWNDTAQWNAAWDALRVSNADRIAKSTLQDWLPYQNDHFNGSADDHVAPLACSDMWRPGTPSGLSTSRVTTFSVQDDTAIQAAWEDVAIVAEGDTVYASPTNLYVATNPYDAGYWAQLSSLWASASSPDTRWTAWPVERTNVHRFDLAGGHTRYAASNEVEGSLIGQFAIDESGDYLRLASTTRRWTFTTQGETSANHVFVLQWGAHNMPLVGQLRDLEKGEHITAVRFMGDRGYLSTLHNRVYADPFLVIDLRNPTAPTLSASLPVPGDSTYLQSLDANHVFGIGTSVSTYGWASGVQLSVFDVTNPAAPVLQSNTPLQGQWVYSEALYDHHALTSFTLPVNGVETHLVAFPLWIYNDGNRCFQYNCALDGVRLYSVDPVKGFSFLGDVYHNSLSSQQAWGWEQVRRSMLFGVDSQSFLVSASELGLKITDLSAFAAQTSEVPSVAQIAY